MIPKCTDENRNSFCSAISLSARSELCNNCVHIELYPKQEYRFEFATPKIAIINTGSVFPFTYDHDGNQIIIELIETGDLYAFIEIFSESQQIVGYLKAFTKSSICIVPAKTIAYLFENDSSFAKEVFLNVSRQVKRLYLHLNNVLSTSSENKIAYVLDLLINKGTEKNKPTQDLISMMTGISRVTVGRALASIESSKPKRTK